MTKLFHGVLCCVLVTGAVQGAPFSELVSFGDSLSDVGNAAGITVNGYAPLIDGYYQQTHFSDNVIWNEMLASYWGLPARTPGRIATGTMPAALSGNDWAWGGSQSSGTSASPAWVTSPIPGLLQQTSAYLANFSPNSTTLYSIWSGADNLLVGQNFSPAAAAAAVDNVKTAILDLENAGARNFLIFNLPDIGDTPIAQEFGQPFIDDARLYSTSFNTALDTALAELRADPLFAGSIYFVDVYTPLDQVVNTVNGGGTYIPNFLVPGPPVAINNVTTKALTYYQTNGTYPDDYLFWDIVHPTTQGHALVAGLALQAVPEPSTYAMALAGLACGGYSMWRRRKRA